MDVYGYLINQFQDEWMQIIRPYRYRYPIDQLGPNILKIENTHVQRSDFNVKNLQQHILRCSLFTPLTKSTYQKKQNFQEPCIIYLHSNSGNRLESLPVMKKVLTKGFSLCSFDFSGAGVSDGEYVTLGYNETNDLNCILEHLSKNYNFPFYCLWGRSMGAFTGLKLGLENRKYDIRAIVLDSPYYSISGVVEDQIGDKFPIPDFVTRGLVESIGEKLAVILQQDLFSSNLLQKLQEENNKLPSILIDDKIIKERQIQTIFNEYKGQKEMKNFTGSHNASRTDGFVRDCTEFLVRCVSQNSQTIQAFQQNSKIQQNNINQNQNFPVQKELTKSKSQKTIQIETLQQEKINYKISDLNIQTPRVGNVENKIQFTNPLNSTRNNRSISLGRNLQRNLAQSTVYSQQSNNNQIIQQHSIDTNQMRDSVLGLPTQDNGIKMLINNRSQHQIKVNGGNKKQSMFNFENQGTDFNNLSNSVGFRGGDNMKMNMQQQNNGSIQNKYQQNLQFQITPNTNQSYGMQSSKSNYDLRNYKNNSYSQRFL